MNKFKPKKVIWIINQFAGTPESGWGERHYYLSKPIVDQGTRVVIISSANNHMFDEPIKTNKWFTYQKYEGVEFLWIKILKYNPKNFTRFIAMFSFTFSILFLPLYKKKLGYPDVIVVSSMSIFPIVPAFLLKKMLNVKKIVTEIRDLWPLTPIYLLGYSRRNPMIWLLGQFEKFAYRKSDIIISLFEEARPYINSISNAPEKFVWIPNGIDGSLLESSSLKNQVTKKIETKIPKEKLVICYTGTIGFANALDPLFDLIEDQKEIKDRVFFLIVGSGYLLEVYKEKAKKQDNILFVEKVKKHMVSAILDLADVCFISWHDSELYKFGVSANKYFDYMGAKKPILAAHNGIRDPVNKSGGGLIVKNDQDAIRAGIIKFLSMSKEELNHMGKKGEEYVLQNHLIKNLSVKFFKTILD